MKAITPEDIAQRVCHKKPHWFHGNPKISLIGENKSFGKLQFDFIDTIITFRIYIQDRDELLETAREAIMDFKNLAG